jgi:hypothetical protein
LGFDVIISPCWRLVTNSLILIGLETSCPSLSILHSPLPKKLGGANLFSLIQDVLRKIERLRVPTPAKIVNQNITLIFGF